MSRLLFFGLCILVVHAAAADTVDNCADNCLCSYCPKSSAEATTCADTTDSCNDCECSFNYLRAENGTCIPTRNCPAFDCPGENEEYNPCPPFCPTDSCAQATPDGRCPLPGRIGIVVECKPTCRCKQNYWRKNGVCVPYAECS